MNHLPPREPETMNRIIRPSHVVFIGAALLLCAAVLPPAVLAAGGAGNAAPPALAAEGTGAAASAPADTLAPGEPPAAGRAAPADTATAPLPSRVRLEFYPDSLGTAQDEDDTPRRIRIKHTHTRRWLRDGDVDVEPWLRYNRVQGLALYARVRRGLQRDDYLPAYHAELGYGFASRRGVYRLGFEQPVAPRSRITLGAEAYRNVTSFFYGDEIIGDGENSASAFFLHRDYRDWYEAQGGRAFLGLYTSPFLSLTAGVTIEDEDSLPIETDWAVFRQEKDFRANPLIPEGTYRAFDATLAYDTRPRDDGKWGDRPSRRGWGAVEHYYRLSWERADAGLGGDFDLWRVTADLRTYFRLSPRQSLSARVLAGAGEAWRTADGFLPVQRRFALGGLSTLRGHSFRSITGDRVALANLQYAFNVTRGSQALVFVDAGTAWDRGSLADQRIPVDVGAGYRFDEEGITLLVGQNVNSSDAETKVFLRFQESF